MFIQSLKIIRNLFDEDKLEKIEIIKKEIGKNRDEKVRELLCAGLLSIVGDLSNYRKGGNGLKRRTVIRDKEPFLEYNKKLEQIAYDLEREKRGPEPDVICDSCLNMEEYAIDDIDLAIFSPPYANCFDPFEIYKIELWIGNFVSTYDELRTKRRRALTSNLNADINKKIDKHHRSKLLTKTIDFLSEQELWDRRIPKMLDIYFYDMNKLMSILHKKIKTGGYCAIIVGNSAYGNLVIPTDLFLAEIGEKNGFETREIIIARKNETSSQQQRKLGKLKEYLRESIVILENG